MRLSLSFAGLRLQVHSWCGAGLDDQPGPVLDPQPPPFFAQPEPSLGLSWFRQILLSEEKNRKKIIYTLIRLSSMRALQNWSQIVKLFSRSYLTRRWPITGTRPITSTGLPMHILGRPMFLVRCTHLFSSLRNRTIHVHITREYA